ncbi:hypothetical protein ATY76_14415 [Rhizobium sp. R339]|uniref:hypothetical protein n=1 Tax=Rhizobium sp. R339 TaxID=1764273 RepID=UPI000B52F15E|nr:hypothetical protein [Rhizobium sp. R339]OWV68096.1 hypothetical protein ATY76_14415 [Rhizobium sp. R339]
MISREELYALVWAGPGKGAAERLGISDSYLGRVCTALDVPRPSRGWWAQRAVGRAAPPPPLPPARPGVPDHWAKGGPSIKQFYRRGIWCTVPRDGSHPLVHFARHLFRKAREGRDGRHLSTRSCNAIDLTTSADTLESALSLANVLFKAFEARGHPVRVMSRSGFIRPALENWAQPPERTRHIPPALWMPVAPTIVTVSGVPIGLAILEISREVEMRYLGNGEFEPASPGRTVHGITWTEWRRVPTGRLKLVAYSPHHPVPWRQEWVEARRNSLGRTTEAIVAELEAAAPILPHAGHFLQRVRDDPV